MADRTPQEKLQEIVKKYDAGEYYLDTANIIREALAVAAEIAEDDDNPHRSPAIADALLAAVKDLK